MENCDKSFLDNLFGDKLDEALRNCSTDYQYLNFLNIYYKILSRNNTAVFISIAIILVFCFLILKVVADKYLAPNVSNICYRFKIPQILAALTLISFANGSPDIINALISSDVKEGSDIILGSLLGAFIFTSTVVVSNVIHQAPDQINLNKFAFKKEIFSYAMVLLIIAIFGIYGQINYILTSILFLMYVLYLFVSIKYSGNFDIKDDGLKHKNSLESSSNIEIRIHSQDKQTYLQKDDEEIKEEKANKNKQQYKVLMDNFENDIEVDFINDFIWDKNQNILINLLELPINIVTFFCVPHFEFFFDQNISKYIKKFMLVTTCFFTTLISLLALFGLNLFSSLVASISIALLVFITTFFDIQSKLTLNISQLFCLISSVSFLQIGASCIIDCIQFIRFQTNINKVFLSMIIISCGNSIGDFFGNGAISKIGNSLMGYMACFSGQLFNLFAGIILFTIFTENKKFDLFGIQSEFNEKNKIIMFLFVSAFSCIILNYAIAKTNQYVLRNAQKKIYIIAYVTFILSSLFIMHIININQFFDVKFKQYLKLINGGQIRFFCGVV